MLDPTALVDAILSGHRCPSLAKARGFGRGWVNPIQYDVSHLVKARAGVERLVAYLFKKLLYMALLPVNVMLHGKDGL